jgi:hypothetical protein
MFPLAVTWAKSGPEQSIKVMNILAIVNFNLFSGICMYGVLILKKNLL